MRGDEINKTLEGHSGELRSLKLVVSDLRIKDWQNGVSKFIKAGLSTLPENWNLIDDLIKDRKALVELVLRLEEKMR